MKMGDKVKIINSTSSFCGEVGTVVKIENLTVDVRFNDRDDELFFYKYEVEIV